MTKYNKEKETFEEIKKIIHVGENIFDIKKKYYKTCNEGNKYLLIEKKEDYFKYNELLSSLYTCIHDNSITYAFFEDKFEEILMNNTNIIYEKISEYFKGLQCKQYTFIKPLHGVVLLHNDILILGKYKFIRKDNLPKYINGIAPNYEEKDNCFEELSKDRCHCYVKINCLAKEPIRAKEIADEDYRVLDNALRFFIGSDFRYRYRIGTDVKRFQDVNEILCLSDDGVSTNYYELGKIKIGTPINIEKEYYSDCLVKSIMEMISKDQLNSIEKRLKTSINWIGMAMLQEDESIAFIQCMFALEGLLQEQTDLISKSITALLSEYAAFLLGSTLDERCTIEKNIKQLYGIRSKIAHGEFANSVHNELDMIYLYTYNIIRSFFEKEELKKITTMKDLHSYITKLRYTL